MSTTGTVVVTVVDNAGSTAQIPAQQFVAVGGMSSSGTANQPIVTRDLPTLVSQFGYGPLVELCALLIANGATVIASKITQNAAGAIRTLGAVGGGITGVSQANPGVVTTTSSHGLTTGDIVTIASVGGATQANGTWPVTVLTATTFSIPVNVTGVYTSGGTVTDTGVRYVTATGGAPTGTSVPTVTLDGTIGAFDTYYAKIKWLTSGTIGTTGITYQISLDTGRNYGPVLALGTANSIAITNTGITINLGAGTVVAGELFTFGTTPPTWSTSGVQSWLTTMQASPYAGQWGSMHLTGDVSGANAATISGYVETLATGYLFERFGMNAVDASPPHAYGGSGQSDSAWSTAIVSDYSARNWPRLLAGAGWYNVPSAVANPKAGTPAYRRPANWPWAARKVQLGVDPKQLSSRVSDGPLRQITVDPNGDPLDQFVYHDERISPTLNSAGFLSLWSRPSVARGYFVRSENLLSLAGSQFELWAVGIVFDLFTSLLVQFFTINIDTTTRTDPSTGALYINDRQSLQTRALTYVQTFLNGQYQPAGTSVVIDPTYNVFSNSKVKVTGTVQVMGYIREFDLTVQIANTSAATG